MQVSMSLTQETIDKLDALMIDMGANSRSDTVRKLTERAQDSNINKKLEKLVERSERFLAACVEHDGVPAPDGDKGQAIDYDTIQAKLDAILAAVNKMDTTTCSILSIPIQPKAGGSAGGCYPPDNRNKMGGTDTATKEPDATAILKPAPGFKTFFKKDIHK